MATVTTLGRGVAMAVPTEMEMTLRLWAQEAAPDAALDRVAGRDAQLRSLLDDLGIPAPARTTVRASVEAVTRWDEATQSQVVLGYRADAVTSVRFGDQAVAGRLMREATAASIGAQVQGPWWRIPPDDPARLQACRLAVDDARARAQAYAEAAGRGWEPWSRSSMRVRARPGRRRRSAWPRPRWARAPSSRSRRESSR